MNSVKVFSIVCATLFVVWAVLVMLFGGEKYMRWYYQSRQVGKYDRKKFKIVHTLFLLFAAVCMLLIGFWNSGYRHIVVLVFVLSSFLQYVLIYTVCKKKPGSE